MGDRGVSAWVGTRRIERGVLSVLVAFGLTWSEQARAAEPATVDIAVDACNGAAFDVDAFARFANIELRGDGVERVVFVAAPATENHADPALATVVLNSLPCTSEARDIDITLEDAITSKSVRRRVALTDIAPGARPRVLALAVAELLRASWGELRLATAPPPSLPVPASVRLALFEPAPAPPRALPAPPPLGLPPPSTQSTSLLLRVDVALEGRAFPSYGSALLGPNIAVSLRPTERLPLRIRVDARALFGTSYDPLGSISTQLLGGGVAVVVAHPSTAVDVELGPHLGVGWGSVSGSAAGSAIVASTGGTGIVDASVLLELRLPLGGSFSATLALDGGGVLHGLDAQSADRRAAGFGGPMAGTALGVGRTF